MDTIFAVSSGRPPAGIAVIRVSGPQAIAAVATMAGPLPNPREARLRTLRNSDGAMLDRALVLTFPGPATATGEDLVELHCHGGSAVIDAVERALAAMPGLRAATAGEFTRRALTNGRIDLAEAQGLADLLAAETERQRTAALDAVEGRVSRAVREWMDRLAMLSARVEAELDFADEDDVAAAGDGLTAVRAAMTALADEIAAIVDTPSVERLRDGIRVVIGGPPNSGKSTLINLLTRREVAIVSPIAGTTRDRVEAPVTRDGIPYVITDTAGLTETDDVVEAIGVARAGAAIEAADILVWLGDDAPPRDALWVHARSDVAGRTALPEGKVLAIAVTDGTSIEQLWFAIGERAASMLPQADRLALSRVQQAACSDAAQLLQDHAYDDALIVAEQLRLASRSLGSILGIDATEVMLDALFRQFCIGK